MFVKDMVAIALTLQRRGGGGVLLGAVLRSFSKLFNTIALFLPLKLLIVVSSPEVPSYLSFLGDWLSKDLIVVSLLIATPIIYFLYIVFGISSSKVLLGDRDKSKKVIMEDKGYRIEGKKISWFHDHCSKGVSELVLIFFCLVVFLSISLIYFFVLLAVSICYFLVMSRVLYPREVSHRDVVLGVPFGNFVEYCSAFAYFALFFLVVIFLVLDVLGLYEALLSLLTSRLYVQSIQRLLIEGHYIDKDLKSCLV